MVACSLLAGTTPVLAQGSDELSVGGQVATAREMLLYARYSEAIPLVEGLLAREDLLATERNEVLEIRAILHLARRETQAGLGVLRELYGRDPGHRLIDRDVGPTVRAAFDRIRESHPPAVTVTLENGTLPQLEARASPAVVARITEGANVAHEVRLNYRNSSSGPYERALMRYDSTDATARARLPMAEGSSAYTVHYYLEVLAPSQAVVARLGSREDPLSIEVPAESSEDGVALLPISAESTETEAGGGSVLDEWWFWTIIGVVLAGGGATVGVLAGTGNLSAVGPGSLGEGSL